MAHGQQELINEIKQISNQYHAEVGRDKNWPKSIKDRITQLVESGMPSTRISAPTGVLHFTVLKWRKTKGRPRGRNHGFKELVLANDVAQKVDAVTATQKLDTQKVVTVTVAQKLAIALGGQVERPDVPVPNTTPDGFRIELPCVDAAIDFIIKLRRIGA